MFVKTIEDKMFGMREIKKMKRIKLIREMKKKRKIRDKEVKNR